MPPIRRHSRLEAIKDALPAALILVLSLAATLGVWRAELAQDLRDGQNRFSQLSQDLQASLNTTLRTYAQVGRGAVGHFHASSDVSRDTWNTYVESLELDENFPGLQGMGYNPAIAGPVDKERLEAQVDATDWPGFRIRPSGVRKLYVPVLYLEPLTEKNKAAIGFDINSESLRAEAIIRAIATGAPNLTAKIRLVQEDVRDGNEREQAGALLLLPIFDQHAEQETPQEREKAISGFIVSVLRMGDLIEEVLRRDGELRGLMQFTLSDLLATDPDPLLYQSSGHAEGQNKTQGWGGKFTSRSTFEIFGRYWTLETHSTPEFERQAASSAPRTVLVAGCLLTLLLTILAWVQSRRAMDSRRAAQASAASQEQIHLLMREVNHRSKNLLGLVQAIARQTADKGSREFVGMFLRRVSALSANQDLLVRSNWQGISIRALAEGQTAFVREGESDRIEIRGEDFILTAEAAQTIGMAFHELATNAAKYGALSNKSGKVTIQWRLAQGAEGQELELIWKERGGPEVKAPDHRGFGSTVLGAMSEQTLGAKAQSKFEKEGLVWSLRSPVEAVKPKGEEQ